MDASTSSSHTLSVFQVPDGMTNPMTPEDLLLVRRDRPDLDERISFASTVVEELDEHPPLPSP